MTTTTNHEMLYAEGARRYAFGIREILDALGDKDVEEIGVYRPIGLMEQAVKELDEAVRTPSAESSERIRHNGCMIGYYAMLVALNTGCLPYTGTRSAILDFYAAMRKELTANADKGHWLGSNVFGLLDHLKDEIRELREVVEAHDLEHIVEEAADVGNLAMMVLDVLGGLPQEAI